YDTAGNLTTLTDPISRTITRTYDTAGRLIGRTLPDGREVRYRYDANGNPIGITPPGRSEHTFTYTPINRLAGYIPPDVGAGDPSTTYSYNVDRQLTGVARPGGQTVSLGYDAAGRRTVITQPRGEVRYQYDPTSSQVISV